MRFAIDAHAIGQHQTGNDTYIRNLIRRFAALDPEADFLAYLSVPQQEADLPARIRTRLVSRNPFLRLGWQLSYMLREEKPALVHVQYTAPFACPVPIVVSVHDVSFIENPEFLPPARAWQLRRTVQRTVRRAARVLTPSEFSRKCIEKHYPEAVGKTVVADNAVSDHFRPMNKDHARAKIRKRFGISSPFILNVGDLQPRKNQVGLIRAFEELLRNNPSLPHRLVMVGQNKYDAPTVRDVAMKSAVAERIHFTGYVPDSDLRLFYCACEAFAFPSFYEGFGIPILEAMACGAAVACSRTSAMPEVADGAALFFCPKSPTEMARALLDIVRDPELRGRMERLGQARAAQFSWEKTARKTLETYYEVAEGLRVPAMHVARAGS